MAQAAGIGWAKQQFAWEEAEPRRGVFNWTKFDDLVSRFADHQMQVIARLDRPPDWTKQEARFKQGPPDDLNDFGDFVFAFVTRYGERVRAIQIWNEPNLWNEWGGRPPDAARYVELLKIAYTRAKQANPQVRVLSAPLAPTLEESPFASSDFTYLDRLYRLGAQNYFDILSANAFGQDLPPEDPPSINVLNFQRVVLLRRLMEQYGDGSKAVWINEYGWNASPDTFPKSTLTWQRVSEAEQAAFTIQGITKARSDWPWAGPLCIWYFWQVGNVSPERPDYYFRLVDPDFTPRLLYYALKAFTQK